MERARTSAAIALVGLLVVGLFVVGTSAPAGGQAGEATNGTAATHNGTATISVSGTGETAAEPDRALVSVAVTATADSASEAAEQLAGTASGLREALSASNRRAGVRTTDYRLFEREENGTRTYVARQTFEAEVSDPGAVGEVIDTAVASGATEVEGVAFTLSDERRRAVRATAIDRAVTDARSQADAVASSTGLAVGDVRSVSTDGGDLVAVRAEAAGAGTTIDSGPVTVTVTVRITYGADG